MSVTCNQCHTAMTPEQPVISYDGPADGTSIYQAHVCPTCGLVNHIDLTDDNAIIFPAPPTRPARNSR